MESEREPRWPPVKTSLKSCQKHKAPLVC